MHVKNFVISLTLILFLICPALAQQNEEESIIHIAVIDVGTHQTPSSFAELFWVYLTELPDIELVERELITQILREQELNLAINNYESSDAVKAGELIGADIIFMLESGQPVEGQIPVRFRLVETRYGMKFWDGALLLDQNEKNHPAQAKEIIEFINTKLTAKNIYGNFIFVGIGAFRSEELSPNWNWIADELVAGLEQNLVMQPAVALLERRRTRPLMDERDLVEGLPETLRSSVVFIDGSFRLDRQKNDNTIIVTLYGYSENKKIFTTNIEGSSENLKLLSEKAALAITDKLKIKHEKNTMEPAREAALLIEQAKSFTAFDDYRRAISLYEAALAIDPNAFVALTELLHVVHFLPEASGLVEKKDEDRELYIQEVVPLLLHNTIRVRRFLKNHIAIKTKYLTYFSKEWMYQSILLDIRSIFYYHSNILSNLGNHNDTLEILRTFQIHLYELYPIFLNTIKKENDDYLYAQAIHLGIDRGYWWASSPQEYLNNVHNWLELCISKRPNNWSTNLNIYSYFIFSECPLWAHRTDNAKIYLAFLNELSQHDNPLIRACAHQAFVQYYAGIDNTIAKTHYIAFIETIVNEIIPTIPEWGNAMGIWNPNLHYTAAKVVGKKYVAESQARIILQILHHLEEFPMGYWRDRILFCYEDLEQFGETQQAVSLLISCRDKLQKEYPNDKDDIETINSWLRVLKEKHPELAIDIELIPIKEYKPLSLLNIKDISYILKEYDLPQSEDCFRKLLIDENSAAIVCVWGRSVRTRCGIIWLNPETFTFRSFQMYELPIEFSLGNLSNLSSFYHQNGPASAIGENTVFVSFPNFGIIIFPDNGKPRLLCEENGLPTNMISSMDTMNGRLYATTGFLFSTGLIEVTLDNFKTKILISPRKRENSHPFDGSDIVNVIADRWANRLWLSVDPNDRRGLETVYHYDPNTTLSTLVSEKIIIPRYLTRLQRQGHFLYISTSNELYSVNLPAEEIAMIAQHSVLNERRREQTFWQTNLYLKKFAGNSNSLICSARDEGGEDCTVIFNIDEPNPKKVVGSSFPSVNNIRDFGSCKMGLLILTPQSLSLIPNSSVNQH